MNSANSLLFLGRTQDRQSLEFGPKKLGAGAKSPPKPGPVPGQNPGPPKALNCGPKKLGAEAKSPPKSGPVPG